MNIRANIQTVTSGELTADLEHAKRAAETGPVFISTNGEVSHVLMTKAQFDRLEPPEDRLSTSSDRPREPGRSRNLAEVLAYDGEGGDFEWEPPRLGEPVSRPAEFE